MDRRGAVKWLKSTAAVAIMIAILGSLLFYILVVPPELREELLAPYKENVSAVFLEVRPGQLSAGEEQPTTKTLNLGNIIVDNTLKTQKQLVSNQFTLKSNIFNSEVAKFSFSTEPSNLKSAVLEMYIQSAKGDGSLTIFVNDIPVYAGKVNPQTKTQVQLPVNQLKTGVNTVKIGLSPPSWAFWTTNSITIFDLNFVTEEYPEEGAVEQVFSLTESEALNAEAAQLTAYVVDQAGTGQSLELIFNNERLFRGLPSTTFLIDLPTSSLKSGANTLTWSVDPGGAYFIKFITIGIKTIEVEGEEKDYYFTISSADKSEIDSGNYNCILYISKISGGDKLNVHVNSHTHDYTFENGEIIDNICNELEAGKNLIKISAPEDIELDLLKLTVGSK